MNTEKSIIIGCDDPVNFSKVASSLTTISTFRYTIISVSRIVDLNSIVGSLNPDLIILCFKNNQQVLSDISFLTNKPEIPLLFLTTKFDSETVFWKKNSIIFTHPLVYNSNSNSFCSRIQSIFLLKNTIPGNEKANTFAEAAIQNNNYSNTVDLSRYVMELDQKVEVLLKVKERIADLYPKVDDPTRIELISIVNTIKSVSNDNKLWENFKIYFEQTNPNFLLILAKKHPELSTKDLKYCCYIKMNMSNNDITNLLGINQESVRTHKYRLKKKLVLPKDQNIISYLRAVG